MIHSTDNNIIFFASHTSSILHYIEPYAKFLRKNKFNIIIFHINSLLNSDSYRSSSIYEHNNLIDIGRLNIKQIDNVLHAINPQLIIDMNFISLISFLLLRLARKNGYKILHLEHGMFNRNHSMRYRIFDIKTSLYRYFFLIRLYLQLLFDKDLKVSVELRYLYNSLFKHNFTGSTYDFGIFYSNYSKKEKNKILDINASNIFITGFPLFEFKNEMFNIDFHKKNNKAVYIHQPYIQDKSTRISYEDEIRFINQLARIFNDHGYVFIIRLHPRTKKEIYHKYLNRNDCKIEHDCPLLQSIANAKVIIGHDSTALFSPVLLNKPVIVCTYPDKNKKRIKLLDKISHDIYNMNELDLLLKSNKMLKYVPKYKEFIKEYIGNNNSYEYGAQIISKIASL